MDTFRCILIAEMLKSGVRVFNETSDALAAEMMMLSVNNCITVSYPIISETAANKASTSIIEWFLDSLISYDLQDQIQVAPNFPCPQFWVVTSAEDRLVPDNFYDVIIYLDIHKNPEIHGILKRFKTATIIYVGTEIIKEMSDNKFIFHAEYDFESAQLGSLTNYVIRSAMELALVRVQAIKAAFLAEVEGD
jgi:hypothetical protein